MPSCKNENQVKEKNHNAIRPSALLHDCQQLVIVTSPNDTSIHANLYKFEKNGNDWKPIGKQHPVNLGRTGLAWGKGLHQQEEGLFKKEGDGKSPSGIFSFGSAFGYADQKTGNALFKLPYIPIDQTTQCIEDSQSKYYNQIINNSKVKQDWEQADFMKRKDDLYKWGVFVKHNTPAKPEKGSCIFFHLWRSAKKPTAGCTAMTEENILHLLKWLNPNKQPKLIQLTIDQYPQFKKQFGLPSLN